MSPSFLVPSSSLPTPLFGPKKGTFLLFSPAKKTMWGQLIVLPVAVDVVILIIDVILLVLFLLLFLSITIIFVLF